MKNKRNLTDAEKRELFSSIKEKIKRGLSVEEACREEGHSKTKYYALMRYFKGKGDTTVVNVTEVASPKRHYKRKVLQSTADVTTKVILLVTDLANVRTVIQGLSQ